MTGLLIVPRRVGCRTARPSCTRRSPTSKWPRRPRARYAYLNARTRPILASRMTSVATPARPPTPRSSCSLLHLLHLLLSLAPNSPSTLALLRPLLSLRTRFPTTSPFPRPACSFPRVQLYSGQPAVFKHSDPRNWTCCSLIPFPAPGASHQWASPTEPDQNRPDAGAVWLSP